MRILVLVRQSLGISASGAVLGLAINAASVHGVDLRRPVFAAAEAGTGTCTGPGSTRITPTAAAGLCSDCTVAFVDARTSSAFALGHVAGAVHLPPVGHADEAQQLRELSSKRTVVVYDDASSCNLADAVVHRLRQVGLGDVRVLEGGWTAWHGTGHPAASGACDLCAVGHP
jgi:rhodanese-related sulfurtransferase